ncbi:ER degradation-enhancing alpha-mannosidase-like protein 3 [Diachasma alloeum]|uniref:ER degradation-enhancing alpha-mannosidase-like protein 3 n=1 Tax=Diachasma alloeum TaxID=454923 RepID=UPI0007383500|nr:ER degradation-enhancing alpha-mannosidase-like protein 3 [Diachasma alloeum]XP_028982285.1 ER degradation-enhancing alpha-mannosidase-like protein 3 [Diachasma alloeum]
MARELFLLGVLVVGHVARCSLGSASEDHVEYMSREERESLKEETRDMFYHAYNAYMDNAYPADELMPLSCKGRYRGSEPDRGDIDSTLGNFSLTLVDTLDTLVVLGDLGEFENAVKLVIKDVNFDTDVIVSLFETNIRMLGGLLSAHILAEYLQTRADIMPWYRGELLSMAKDLGYKFLPAFNTTTGIPYGRINLKHGMKGVPAEMCRETCTACAGSMILEMAALSRLTGEYIFEEKAQKAMDALWRMRHRGTDLMGSVLNVHSGDWVRRDSGVGAGIDSYYEYCLKAYILLGDEKYLGRFNRHYQAIMKYVSQGPMLLDVHMHRPNTNSKNFMDALLAFWPGLQVLKGDIKPAVETHEMLYQVMQRHNFIPEAFTTDFQVHWGHHPLRPEFLESTYFLYRATGDHYYLGVGRKVLRSLQTYARVPCGYAAVSDVRTNKHDDTMDSFVLSETFKYLFLLFTETNDLVLDLDEFIFTTEGHLLPLTLASVRPNVSSELDIDAVQVQELDRTCPNSLHLFPASVRQPLRNMVEDVCPRRIIKRRLSASQFQANNLEHLKILSHMGITILTSADGRIQLLHTFSNARTVQDAEEGLMFMQEMVELNRRQTQDEGIRPQTVTLVRSGGKEMSFLGGPAQFGPKLRGEKRVVGKPVLVEPSKACEEITNAKMIEGNIALVSRGNCMFVEKARIVQKAGAIAGIVLDNGMGSSAGGSHMFSMSGDESVEDDVKIPFVFLFYAEASELVKAVIGSEGELTVTIGDYTGDENQLKSPVDDQSMFERLKTSVKEFLSRPVSTQSAGVISTPSTPQQTSEDELLVFEKGHMRASILKATENQQLVNPNPLVRLSTKSSTPPLVVPVEEDMSLFKRVWREVKQILVNQIHASTKTPPNEVIPLSQIKVYYDWLAKERKNEETAASENLSAWMIVNWFVTELSDTVPNLDILDSSGMPPTSKSLAMRLTSLLLRANQNSQEMKALIEMVDSFKVYGNLLENIKEVLENLKGELKKAAMKDEDGKDGDKFIPVGGGSEDDGIVETVEVEGKGASPGDDVQGEKHVKEQL